jgi:uncharacterized protein (DUF433 family)
MQKLARITIDPAKMNGEPCIRGLRLTVRRVLEALATYPDREELKREYPELQDEDIRQALAFATGMLDDRCYPRQRTNEAPSRSGPSMLDRLVSDEAKDFMHPRGQMWGSPMRRTRSF